MAKTKLQVVEKTSGNVVVDLGSDYPSIMSRIQVVWSADSKRLAYRTAGEKEWSTEVYIWDGSAFRYIKLPEELPTPDIKSAKATRKAA